MRSPPWSLLKKAPGPFHRGGHTYLVYDGEATSVRLRTFMPRFPTPPPFTRLGDGSRWYLQLHLPAAARLEYLLAIEHDGQHHEITDPLNPAAAANPFGTNSVIGGPAYRPAQFPSVSAASRGRVIEVRVPSTHLGGRRHHQVYLPAGYRRGQPIRLLLVHDGPDFARFAGLVDALDGLIAASKLPSLVAVLLHPWRRMTEYGASRLHTLHLVEEVLPHLKRRLGVESPPQLRALLGSSMGAVAALAAAWHRPDQFGPVGLLSGTFLYRPHHRFIGDEFRAVIDLQARLVTDRRFRRRRMFLSAGRYEGLVDLQRRLVPLLRGQQHQLRVVETWDGHHWGAWRDRLADCLPFLFPVDTNDFSSLPLSGSHSPVL
ncbi:MAG TPA: alpha/beta hydrolase-fold protein [Acidimicrobiia bacterium]|nr:alpha/beta hydrolase-fold protein [Acidimicrobiia bacterium]